MQNLQKIVAEHLTTFFDTLAGLGSKCVPLTFRN